MHQTVVTLGAAPVEQPAEPDYPIVAESYSQVRRDMAKKIGLGRKPGTKVAAKPSKAGSKAAAKPRARPSKVLA